MVRAMDPTSKILLAHYSSNYKNGSTDSLANLILNIAFVRNTMSKEIVKLCAEGELPWLTVEHGVVSEDSKKAADQIFLQLGGRVFFQSVEPMKSRSKCPRRGWGELVSELVQFAKKAQGLAQLWQGGNAVADLSAAIRKISGFGGKGFRPSLMSPHAQTEMQHRCFEHDVFEGLRLAQA